MQEHYKTDINLNYGGHCLSPRVDRRGEDARSGCANDDKRV